MEGTRAISKIGISMVPGSLFFLSRYISPEVLDSLAGGPNGRAALEHGFSSMAWVLLFNGLGLSQKLSLGLFAVGRVLTELQQSIDYLRPIQVEQLLSDGLGLLLGVAVCALIDGAFPVSKKDS